MIQKNKILDKIFKKLIKKNFQLEEIKNFIEIEREFNKFENYILYLFNISTKSYNDPKFLMAGSINLYLEYLINEHKIQPFTLDKFNINDNFSINEIYLLGARGFDTNHPYSFDIDDNCYIALNDHPFEEYKDIVNVSLCSHNHSFLNSLINQKLLGSKLNNIFIFKKLISNYKFLGIYSIMDIGQVYKNESAFPSLILMNNECDENDLLVEYLNLNNRNYLTSLELLKNDVKHFIIKHRNDANKFLDLIDDSHCHYILLYNLIQHSLIINDLILISEIKNRFKLMLKQVLMLPIIIPNKTIIDQFYLSLFADTYDILYGMQINADFMHNIYLVIDHKNYEKHCDENINIRFVKSYGKYFFNLDINQKIFNTISENTCIYLFIKHDDKIIYNGMYCVSKLIIGLDLGNNKTPIFIIRPLKLEEKQKHLIYIQNNLVTNNYKNIFINLFKDGFAYMDWFKNVDAISPLQTNRKNNLLNTRLYKFNWTINKCLTYYEKDEFNGYNFLFFKLINEHLFNVINCINYKYDYIIKNKIMQPWTIAYQMTKQNFIEKELFNIAYVDFYEIKENKYNICLDIINKISNL